MGEKSKIEWTDATWNPIVGCSVISPGCTNCYAMRSAHRIEAMREGSWQKVLMAGKPIPDGPYSGTTKVVNGNPVWTGKLALAPESTLLKPLRWKRPRMIFVNSMSDLFHENVPDEWIDRVFGVIACCPQHTFQILTKRSNRMRSYFERLAAKEESDWLRDPRRPDVPVQVRHCIEEMARSVSGLPFQERIVAGGWPLSNVWLGNSVEDQKRADARREHLQAIAAQGWTTFVSYEPALGPVDWTGWECLSWLISGGESGPGARPSHPGWHRAARDFCQRNRIAYFFKQYGEYSPGRSDALLRKSDSPGAVEHVNNGAYLAVSHDGLTGEYLNRTGKKHADRLLDGRTWDEMPSAVREGVGA
jgi:protein gp37